MSKENFISIFQSINFWFEVWVLILWNSILLWDIHLPNKKLKIKFPIVMSFYNSSGRWSRIQDFNFSGSYEFLTSMVVTKKWSKSKVIAITNKFHSGRNSFLDFSDVKGPFKYIQIYIIIIPISGRQFYHDPKSI